MKSYQAVITIGILAFLAILIYWQLDTLTPFIFAFITAYLLQPLTCWLERTIGMPRTYISMLIIGLFILFLIIISIVVVPFLYDQISLFIQKFPIYKDIITNKIVPGISDKLDNIDFIAGAKIKLHIQNTINKLFGETFNILNNIWHYTLSTIHFFANMVLVPFILFYLIRDWKGLTTSIEEVVPVAYKENYNLLTTEVNILLAAYIRGQLNICMILMAYYSIVLTILQIDFALLLGVITGFLIIIPFIGFTISLALSLIVAYFANSPFSMYIYILLFYMIGHALEVYILIPRLIGRNIGLHPVWVIFSVLALGNLYGIVGIIMAIPIAGIIKILLTFAFRYYKSSKLYNL